MINYQHVPTKQAQLILKTIPLYIAKGKEPPCLLWKKKLGRTNRKNMKQLKNIKKANLAIEEYLSSIQDAPIHDCVICGWTCF